MQVLFGRGTLSELAFSTTMLAINVVVGGAVVFALLAVFAQQRHDAQERADTLLLNILPRSIADKLKATPQTIADAFTSASILFADVVDFTPYSREGDAEKSYPEKAEFRRVDGEWLYVKALRQVVGSIGGRGVRVDIMDSY